MGYRLRAPTEEQVPPPTQVKAAVTKAWDSLKTPILGRVAHLEAAIAALEAGDLPEDLRCQAEHAAHKLIGSLGMFGMTEGSRISRDIEAWLQQPPPNELSQLRSLIIQLKQELRQVSPLTSQDIPLSLDAKTALPEPQMPLVLMVDDDSVLTQQVQQVGPHYGLRIAVATRISEAKKCIAQEVPALVLLDLSFPKAPRDGLTLLDELSTRYPQIPVLVFSANDQFRNRLDVARRGSYAFLSKSLSYTQILSTIREILGQTNRTTAKILAVDDDPVLLDSLSHSLQSESLDLITLTDPRQFWGTLITTTPNLLILDVEMPYISGIELCQVIRNDMSWNRLPILFLTAHNDVETIHRIFDAGGDDYLCKPFQQSELIARISKRLERNRLLQQQKV